MNQISRVNNWILKVRGSNSFVFPRKMAANMIQPLLVVDNIVSSNQNLLIEPINISQNFFPKDNYTGSLIFYLTVCVEEMQEAELGFLQNMQSNFHLILIVNCGKHKSHKFDDFLVETRKNLGRDLAAYRDVFRKYRELNLTYDFLFMNSSCFWSAEKLTDYIVKCQTLGKICFMTESNQGALHYQTFYIYFPKKLVSEIYRLNPFEIIRNWHFKRSIVKYGEYGLAKILRENNLPTFSFFNLKSAFDSKSNPSLIFSKELVAKGAPFVKKNAIF